MAGEREAWNLEYNCWGKSLPENKAKTVSRERKRQITYVIT